MSKKVERKAKFLKRVKVLATAAMVVRHECGADCALCRSARKVLDMLEKHYQHDHEQSWFGWGS